MKAIRTFAILVGLTGLGGCTAVALTAGGIASGAGVEHTLSGIAYKTFTSPMENVHLATLQTLKQVDISVKDDRKAESGWEIAATANEREIDVALEALPPARHACGLSSARATSFPRMRRRGPRSSCRRRKSWYSRPSADHCN